MDVLYIDVPYRRIIYTYGIDDVTYVYIYAIDEVDGPYRRTV